MPVASVSSIPPVKQVSKSTSSTDEKYLRPTKTGINRWNLSGKVAKKDSRYASNGMLVVTIRISVPSKNPKYTTTFFLKAFKELAEDIEKNVEEGSNYVFFGYFSNSSFKKGEETIHRTDYVISKYGTAFDETTTSSTPESTEGVDTQG